MKGRALRGHNSQLGIRALGSLASGGTPLIYVCNVAVAARRPRYYQVNKVLMFNRSLLAYNAPEPY